jgi:hypothetical protein
VSGKRTVRTRPRNRLAIVDVLTAAMVSELCWPSEEFWLVTGWVTDMPVIDNAPRHFDAVMGADPRSSMTLSDVLGTLTRRGTQLHVAVREEPHNQTFVERLRRVSAADALHLYSSADLHEKVMVGWTWVLKGSMNFTWNGTQRNEESLDLQVDRAEAARQRLELRTRWMGSQS